MGNEYMQVRLRSSQRPEVYAFDNEESEDEESDTEDITTVDVGLLATDVAKIKDAPVGWDGDGTIAEDNLFLSIRRIDVEVRHRLYRDPSPITNGMAAQLGRRWDAPKWLSYQLDIHQITAQ